jgi:hypothetical protein
MIQSFLFSFVCLWINLRDAIRILMLTLSLCRTMMAACWCNARWTPLSRIMTFHPCSSSNDKSGLYILFLFVFSLHIVLSIVTPWFSLHWCDFFVCLLSLWPWFDSLGHSPSLLSPPSHLYRLSRRSWPWEGHQPDTEVRPFTLNHNSSVKQGV